MPTIFRLAHYAIIPLEMFCEVNNVSNLFSLYRCQPLSPLRSLNIDVTVHNSTAAETLTGHP